MYNLGYPEMAFYRYCRGLTNAFEGPFGLVCGVHLEVMYHATWGFNVCDLSKVGHRRLKREKLDGDHDL